MSDYTYQTELINRVKDEYLKGDLAMSELLRNEEFIGLSKYSKVHLLVWAGEDEPVNTLIDRVSDIKSSAVNSFEIRAKEIADETFKKAWRLIKKTRWQGHYNTRKRSRRM